VDRPTHQWCPECNAMLPPHLEECPRCQTNLKTGGKGREFREILQITLTIVGVSIIPFIIIIAIGVLCINIMR
jgi:uncharacterized paraquat-inducible protein A